MRQRDGVTFRNAPRKLGGGGAHIKNNTNHSTCRAFDMPSEREREDELFEWGIGIELTAVWALCCFWEVMA